MQYDSRREYSRPKHDLHIGSTPDICVSWTLERHPEPLQVQPGLRATVSVGTAAGTLPGTQGYPRLGCAALSLLDDIPCPLDTHDRYPGARNHHTPCGRTDHEGRKARNTVCPGAKSTRLVPESAVVTDAPVLKGERVTLRPAVESDLPRFAEVLRSPEVRRWWGDPPETVEALRSEFLGEEAVVFAVETDGDVAGFIQYAEESDPQYRSAGIDIALASNYLGHGFGTDAVRTMARYLFEVRNHHRLTIDPAAANARAIACYRKVGFRPVGIMRQYERGVDGKWHDGLLMDLLREELR